MSRHGADEVSGSEELQKRMRLAVPATMSADQRDRLIVMLNDKGWDHGRIGRATGLSRRGVGMTLQRIREGRPGRIRSE
jgi:hypothetical protein